MKVMPNLEEQELDEAALELVRHDRNGIPSLALR